MLPLLPLLFACASGEPDDLGTPFWRAEGDEDDGVLALPDEEDGGDTDDDTDEDTDTGGVATLTWRITLDPEDVSSAVFAWTYDDGDGNSCGMVGGVTALVERTDCEGCAVAADFTLGDSTTAEDDGACEDAAALGAQLSGQTYGWGHGETVLEEGDAVDTHMLMVDYGDGTWSPGGAGSWLVPATDEAPAEWTLGQDALALE
jgi:hypothetical protein